MAYSSIINPVITFTSNSLSQNSTQVSFKVVLLLIFFRFKAIQYVLFDPSFMYVHIFF